MMGYNKKKLLWAGRFAFVQIVPVRFAEVSITKVALLHGCSLRLAEMALATLPLFSRSLW